MDTINRKLKKVVLRSTILLQMCLTSIILINAQPSAPSTVEFVLTRTPSAPLSVMQRNANAVFTEINRAAKDNRGLNLSENNVTKEAIENLKLIWATSHFHCTKPIYYQTINNIPQGYSVRNISVFLHAEKTLDNKNQDIVINFDKNGKISNVSLAMEKIQYEKIIAIGINPAEISHRERALEFLEQLKTYYCRKDIDNISNVFSDYALIISGYKITTMDPETRIPKSSVTYNEKNKEEYISDLKRVFASNRSLDIKFPEDKISIMQHPNNKKVYSIRCWQDWSSVRLDGSLGYSDSGWLTLIIDFEKELEPKIWVRAWQDHNFRENELVKIGDFNF